LPRVAQLIPIDRDRLDIRRLDAPRIQAYGNAHLVTTWPDEFGNASIFDAFNALANRLAALDLASGPALADLLFVGYPVGFLNPLLRNGRREQHAAIRQQPACGIDLNLAVGIRVRGIIDVHQSRLVFEACTPPRPLHQRVHWADLGVEMIAREIQAGFDNLGGNEDTRPAILPPEVLLCEPLLFLAIGAEKA
jgi:hypothetical protein